MASQSVLRRLVNILSCRGSETIGAWRAAFPPEVKNETNQASVRDFCFLKIPASQFLCEDYKLSGVIFIPYRSVWMTLFIMISFLTGDLINKLFGGKLENAG